VNVLRVINNLFRFNRANWKAVSLCFLAATVFWFFRALNKDYSTNVTFPIVFEFDQQKFVAAKPLPRNIGVNVDGIGWDLLRKNIGVKLPVLTIPLEHPAEIKKIVGSTLPGLIANQLGNLKINHVVTDTLYISIEPKDSVKVRILADMHAISFKEGYGITSPIVILPDSVQLSGPRSFVRHFPDTLVLSLPEDKLSGNYREHLEVKLQGLESIKRDPPVVEVMFEVGQILNKEEVVKLDLKNSPAGWRIMKDMDSIHYVVQIPMGRVDAFVEGIKGIKATLDLTDVRSGAVKMVPDIRGIPSYAKLVRVDSVRVKLY
jgi:hypothetical protein